MKDEEFWDNGSPAIGVDFKKTQDEEFWVNGQPCKYISKEDDGSLLEFFWGIQ
jgi:hypothetical protein